MLLNLKRWTELCYPTIEELSFRTTETEVLYIVSDPANHDRGNEGTITSGTVESRSTDEGVTGVSENRDVTPNRNIETILRTFRDGK